MLVKFIDGMKLFMLFEINTSYAKNWVILILDKLRGD